MSGTTHATPLQRAAGAFDRIIDERGWGEPPLLLRTRGGLDPEHGAELAVHPLDGHPAESLVGFSAPLGWTAIGVSAEGWAGRYQPDPAGYRATAAGDGGRERVRSLVLVDRQGQLAGGLRGRDGLVVDTPPTEGLVLDCLRRALGLGTARPTVPTGTFFAQLWLAGVIATGDGGGRRLTWPEARALHPAAQLLAPDGPPTEAGDVVGAARALAQGCDWSMVRHQIMGGWDAGLGPAEATWMDAGMLSRWLLAQQPPVADLLAAARSRTSPAAHRRITRALADLGVLPAGGGGAEADPGAGARGPGAA